MGKFSYIFDGIRVVAGETSLFIEDSTGKTIKHIAYDCPYAPFEKHCKPKGFDNCTTQDCESVNGDCSHCQEAGPECPYCGTSPMQLYDGDTKAYCINCHMRIKINASGAQFPLDEHGPNGEPLDGWSDS